MFVQSCCLTLEALFSIGTHPSGYVFPINSNEYPLAEYPSCVCLGVRSRQELFILVFLYVHSTSTMATPAHPTIIPLIINGKEEYTESTFDVISPYINQVCWKTASASAQDAIRAVEAAEAAFPSWSQTKPTIRRNILLKAADILESRLEQNSEYMRTEMGADVGASLHFIAPLGIRMLRDIAGRITSICGSVPVVDEEGQSAMIYREPMGVILGIVPWYVRCCQACE